MAYKWDKKLLYELWKNPIAREELQSLYHSLWDIFNLFANPRFTKTETVLEDCSFFDEFNFIRPYLESSKHFLDIKDAKHTYENLLTKDQIMTIAHDFFKQTNPEIYQNFLKHFNKRFTHFQFNNFNINNFYSGYTYVSLSTGNTFIATGYKNNISSLNILVHEFGHAINSNMNFSNTMESSKAQFDEIFSIFLELLLFDYLEKTDSFKSDVNFERQSSYITFFNDIEALADKLAITDLLRSMYQNEIVKNISFHHFFKKLNDNLGYFKSYIKDILQKPAYITTPYVLGMLIAIELYHYYQTDPEYAFYLAKQIIMFDCDTPENIHNKIKELGIYPTQNIETFTRKLKL